MRRSLAVLLIPVVLAAFAPAAPVPKHLMKGPVYYYPTSVGTTWVYENQDGEETLTITKVEDADGAKVVTIEKKTAGGLEPDEKMSVSAGGLTRLEGCGWKMDPPLVMLKVPFRAGDKWKSDANRLEENVTIVGVEQVKVPAGAYESVCVAAKYATNGQKEAARFWYAPGVGLVKWATMDGSRFLSRSLRGSDEQPVHDSLIRRSRSLLPELHHGCTACGREVPADQVVLHFKQLCRCVSRRKGREGIRDWPRPARRPSVRAEPSSQGRRLSDVKKVASVVADSVDARPAGCSFETRIPAGWGAAESQTRAQTVPQSRQTRDS